MILKKASIYFGLIVLFIAIMTVSTGCTHKTTIKIPKAILHAKDASLEELLDIVNQYDEINTLIAGNLKADYTSEKTEGDLIELKDYPRAPGFILLKRPDSIFFVIMAPVAKTRILSLASVGDEFRVYYKRKDTFYIGSNSAKELVSEDLDENLEIPIRATHILDAIFPKTIPLHDSKILYTKIEKEDEHSKYYVLEVFRNDPSRRIHKLREFWIERSGLTLFRQRVYDDEGRGRIVGNILYSDVAQYEKYTMPRKIRIERPLDGYNLDLEFKDWKINPVIKDEKFDLQPLEGVKQIRFNK